MMCQHIFLGCGHFVHKNLLHHQLYYNYNHLRHHGENYEKSMYKQIEGLSAGESIKHKHKKEIKPI